MRTLIEWLLSRYLPPRGSRRTEALPPAEPRRHFRATLTLRRSDFIDADGAPMVRPYLIAWEQELRRVHTSAVAR